MNEKQDWLREFYNYLLGQYEPLQMHLDGDAVQDKYASKNHQKLLDIHADIVSLMDSLEAYADSEGVTL